MDILIPILLLIGLYIYMWYASTDVLKGTKMYSDKPLPLYSKMLVGWSKFSNIKWITYIPVVNMIFTLVITQIEVIEFMGDQMEVMKKQMKSQLKKGG